MWVKNKKRVWLLIIAVAAICILALLSALAIRSASERKIAGLLDLGGKYLAELDYEQAVVSYLAVIEIDPKCEEAYMGVAEAYLQMGEYGKAMEYAMQGYSQTGDERLLEKVEMIQALADMVAQGGNMEAGSSADISESDVSQNVLEEEMVYGECIVDGIYHHGYAKYEITDKDEAFFDTLIAYTEAERYEECAGLLKDWQCHDFVLKFQHLNNFGAIVYMAYKGYKIGINTFGTIWLIPEGDGVGALYKFLDETRTLGPTYSEESKVEFIMYTYCECTDGMYNGSFVSHVITRIQKYDYVAEMITEGEVVNGLINGQVTTYYDNPPYEEVNGQRYFYHYGNSSGTGSYYSIFSRGKVQKVEYETAESVDGTLQVGALIRFNEDATPVLAGVWLSQEDVENDVGIITPDGYGLSSPTEREDGSYEVYSY